MKLNKKAFTLVELVVVIAVVAILAAVLIPTFSGLIDAANTSADIQTVKQLNTILAAEKPSNTSTLKTALENNGIEVDNCKPISKGTYYYYVAEKNIIVYCDSDNKILYPEDTGLSYSASMWAPFPLGSGESIAKVESGKDTVLTTTANNAETTLVSVSVPSGATEASTLKLVVKDTSGGINLLGPEGNYIIGDYSFDISLQDGDGDDVSAPAGQTFTVNIQLPTGLNGDDLEVYHKETKMDSDSYTYNEKTGNLKITTSSFSPYRVFWNKTVNTIKGTTATNATITYKKKNYTPSYTIELNISNNAYFNDMYVDFNFVSTDTNIAFAALQLQNYEGSEAVVQCGDCCSATEYYCFRGTSKLPVDSRLQVKDYLLGNISKLYLVNANKSTVPSGVLEIRLFSDKSSEKYIVVDRIKLTTTSES